MLPKTAPASTNRVKVSTVPEVAAALIVPEKLVAAHGTLAGSTEQYSAD